MSQINDKNKEMAKSALLADHEARQSSGLGSGHTGANIFKQSQKESLKFQKMTEKEKMRYYTRLCVDNRKILDANKGLKTKYMTLVRQNEGVAEEELVDLKTDNRSLRVKLRNLTRTLNGDTKVRKSDVLTTGKNKIGGRNRRLYKTVKDKRAPKKAKVQYVKFQILKN